MTDIDRVTGQPADAYTPPEDRVAPGDRTDSVLTTLRLAHERQARLRPQVEKVINHYERGLLSLGDLVQMLAQIDAEE